MTTMTTSERETIVRKAVRARSLTDPLGAMGFRTHSQRVRKETRLRRLMFAATTIGFAGILASIIATSPLQPISGGSANSTTVTVTRRTQDERVVAPSAQSSQPQPTHARTRGS